MKLNEVNAAQLKAIQEELKVFLDETDVHNSFFTDACVRSDEFDIKWHEDCLKEMIDAGFTWEYTTGKGGEGQGEVYYTVYNFTKDGMSFFVMFDGAYYSYDGATFEEWRFVQPKQKTITVYE